MQVLDYFANRTTDCITVKCHETLNLLARQSGFTLNIMQCRLKFDRNTYFKTWHFARMQMGEILMIADKTDTITIASW